MHTVGTESHAHGLQVVSGLNSQQRITEEVVPELRWGGQGLSHRCLASKAQSLEGVLGA